VTQQPPTSSQPSAPTPATTDFEDVLSRPAIHEHDRVPRWVMRSQGLVVNAFSYDRRSAIAVALVLIAILGAVLLTSTRLLRTVFETLDIFAFLGLFLINWIGNGGILVPVPGARFIGLIMIFQQALILPSWEVFAVSGAAMALGLVSYYVAGARSADAYEKGDSEGAQQVVADTTILTPVDEPAETPDPSDDGAISSRRHRLKHRFSATSKRAQERAQPTIEKHGVQGMFWLCFAPSPAGAAAAFLGGAMRFGFTRFLLAAFTSKYLLAGIIVLVALVLSEGTRSIG
jgi:hypothetical protein